MRIIPVITALLVMGFLYVLVLERDRLQEFTRAYTPAALLGGDAEQTATDGEAEDVAAAPEEDDQQTALPEGTVRVMAMRSTAQEIDSAVILRGETEALRQVEVRAETSGKIVSEPLRRGTFVEAGQMMCEIDTGTRRVSKQEAQARLAEANSRVPEAGARLAEARAQVPAAKARIAEAEAGVPAAEARLLEARSRVPEAEARLLEARARIPASEARLAEAKAKIPETTARLAEAEARYPEAEARLLEAQARVKEAEINLNAARQLARDGFAAQTRLASAEAAYESSKAQVQSALSGLKSAEAGIQAAKSQVEGARAGVETARSDVESAIAGVQAAQSQVENARAGVETALSSVEGARAAVISAKASLEGALAAIEAALSGEENARAGIQSAEAALATTDKEIDRLSITAPFSGLLETDTAELGALMQPGGVCATIIQLNPIKIVGFVPEVDVARVELGARAGARLVGDTEVVGQVSFVSRSADPVTRTFRVELTAENADLLIRDGQTAAIAIEAEGAPAHLLPQSALTLNDEGDLGVRSIDADGLALFNPVKLLRDTRDGVWVTGLPDQVDVITVGQEFVTDGVPVAPSFEEVIQ
ncbi:efflux RND transporter periplasmic adaptor subunit [Thalassococcus lentus]|uniref:Efflux RND transporter periplasmic adaptor subunit n=1 Tax=Thalassococcus lentus TaxID=1210524 RepID=A0ABT4XX70_9RHOB|nr:efflux RND transporter periplasmic adaptor subunit [Thalassococcus lentus]MDA7426554.1 efflux RND transporter periplasmic adaptor subunit [Thalassococcus lentus]